MRDQTPHDAVIAGIAMDAACRAEAVIIRRNVERFETLTPRECEVLNEVARGRVNKQIAFDLGISEVTVKLHRGNAMRKMEARFHGRADSDMGKIARADARGRCELGTGKADPRVRRMKTPYIQQSL